MISIQTLHRHSTGGNLRMNMNSVPIHMRNLLQYKHVCSYCRRTGHNEEDCILHNVDSEVDKENVLPKTSPSPSSLFYSSHYSTKKRTITKEEATEVIPSQFWLLNQDPVKVFLNNNNIHNYRTQQQWNKKIQYRKPLV
jgi:hypothetical protein